MTLLRVRFGVQELSPLLMRASNRARKPSLKTPLAWAPESSIIGEDDVTALFTNLPAILENSHDSEFAMRNTIRTPWYEVLFSS